MMKARQMILWGLGLLTLAFLIQYPIQKTDTTWKSWSLPLSGKTIVIDPGHGGFDGGAVGRDKTEEKEISLLISKRLQDYLQQAGALVFMTRETDKDLATDQKKRIASRKSEDIRNRLKMIHGKKADFFVTVHLNALPDGQWKGAQSFYYPSFDENQLLATFIQDEIKRNLENTNRQALGIQGIYLLKHAKVPGALVEVGFLSNSEELQMLKSEKYQEQMAGSIYNGILRYVTEKDEAKQKSTDAN
ncbi:N-acetylmuramoyl-L-alanine amidase CwlD [Aciduricibacillus chroicocephali]|uniref:N-acetylmuramoyl-L-alanine amidase CwlD n=1 Tax=Aciduricibacillus chroicocephali TaxID=3054939 RepID=A0ABY9KW64_9BACI|nr:N-acetylmuramoyl-L-alanine amidase CwlD [Bacillaceae bacterium 44XB]